MAAGFDSVAESAFFAIGKFDIEANHIPTRGWEGVDWWVERVGDDGAINGPFDFFDAAFEVWIEF